MQGPSSAKPVYLKEEKNQIKIKKNQSMSQVQMGGSRTKSPNARLSQRKR